MKKLFKTLCLCVALLLPNISAAAGFAYTLEEFKADLQDAQTNGKELRRLSDMVQANLNEAGFNIGKSRIFFNAPNALSISKCMYDINLSYAGHADIDAGSQFVFLVNSLKAPIISGIQVSGNADATGVARVGAGLGVFFGCAKPLTLTGEVSINSDFNVWVSMTLMLNPVLTNVSGQRAIVMTPTVTVRGDATLNRLKVTRIAGDVSFMNLDIASASFDTPVIGDLLGRLLQGTINRTIIDNWAEDQKNELTEKINTKLINSYVDQSGRYTLSLPEQTTDELQRILPALLSTAKIKYPISASYLNLTSTKNAILESIFTADSFSLNEVMGRAACSYGAQELMKTLPIYAAPSDFTYKNQVDQCYEYIADGKSKIQIGNPKTWGSNLTETPWENAWVAALDARITPLDTSKSLPYLKRVLYKTVNNVQERKKVSIFNRNRYLAALKECNGAGYYDSYCNPIITKNKLTQTASNDSSEIYFNIDEYNYDFKACVDKKLQAYPPGSYRDSNKPKAESECYDSINPLSKYRLVIDSDKSTKYFDPKLRDTVITACTTNGGWYPGKTVSVANTSYNCGTTYPPNPAASQFYIEVESPIQRGDGVCKLEMRVYKENSGATNLKPIIAFHGGSWSHRSFGITGIESYLTELTSKGYIVFVPTYRLTSELEGNIECNGVSSKEIVEDAKDALTWVRANGSRYGSNGTAPALFGQSAGAYLAGYLATHNNTSNVKKALLLYPPTDMVQAATQIQQGNTNYLTGIGRSSLEDFLDNDLIKINLNDPVIQDLSLPISAISNAAPVYILHGNLDQLVPLDQSLRLCNKLGGSASIQPGIYNCGASSKLEVIVNSIHMFDVCLPGVFCNGQDQKLRDDVSFAPVRASISRGLQWLLE